MKKLKVALLSGGISSEREVSLRSGQEVYNALNKDKYEVYRYDPKTDMLKIVENAGSTDVALIILHGPYGEDGTIQGMLDLLSIPYQGSGVLGSAICMDKIISKQLYEKHGLNVAQYDIARKAEPFDKFRCFEKIGFPMVIKPARGGSSIGMSIIDSKDMFDAAIEKGFQYDNSLLLESFVKGTEITCGVLGNDNLMPLPLIEIIPAAQYKYFDYEAKYKPGATKEICPARVSEKIAKKAQEYAVMAHRALCCRGYSRTDMIIKNDDIFILETNTIPGMTSTSLLPQAAKVAGINFPELLDKLIDLALESRKDGVTQ